jgi:hypothetical protein
MSDARRASALSSVRRGGDGRSRAADLEVVELGQGERLDPLPGVEDAPAVRTMRQSKWMQLDNASIDRADAHQPRVAHGLGVIRRQARNRTASV